MLTVLKYGNTSTFLIRGTKANLLVDTDYAGTLPAFYKAIKDIGIKVSDIDYVMATHYHPDHIGLISELMDQGVKLLLIESQVPYVHYSDHIFAREPHLDYKPIDESKALVLGFDDARAFFDSEIGFSGDVMGITSHGEGSVVITLDQDNILIAGDLEPLEYMDAYEKGTPYRNDWDKILRNSPKRVCYAHSGARDIAKYGIS